MDLPQFKYDFSHARINDVTVGPRREATLFIAPLVWEGPNGRYGEVVRVRFGGIRNFEEVSTFFAEAPE
jgi:hypothetical protein